MTKLPPLPPDVEALLAKEREPVEVPPGVDARVLSRVRASVTAGSLPRAGAPRRLSTLARTIGTLAVGAVVGSGVHAAMTRVGRTGTPATPTSPSPSPSPNPVPVPLAAPSSSQSPSSSSSPPSPSSIPPPAPIHRESPPLDGRFAAERALVETARTALGRGHPAAAIAALRRHAATFPDGVLAEERDSLLVQALVASGDPTARDRAAAFHARYPHSLFGPIVDEALRSLP